MAGRLRYPGFGVRGAAAKYQAGLQSGLHQKSSSSLSWLTDPLQGSSSSSSSYGSYGGGGLDPGSCFSLDICPDLILAAIAAAAAAAAFLIYQAITVAGRRKKRETDESFFFPFLEEVLGHALTKTIIGLLNFFIVYSMYPIWVTKCRLTSAYNFSVLCLKLSYGLQKRVQSKCKDLLKKDVTTQKNISKFNGGEI